MGLVSWACVLNACHVCSIVCCTSYHHQITCETPPISPSGTEPRKSLQPWGARRTKTASAMPTPSKVSSRPCYFFCLCLTLWFSDNSQPRLLMFSPTTICSVHTPTLLPFPPHRQTSLIPSAQSSGERGMMGERSLLFLLRRQKGRRRSFCLLCG